MKNLAIKGKLAQLNMNQENLVKDVVAKLVERSCVFQVEPLPDGEYEITTKDEGHLERVLKELNLDQPSIFVIVKIPPATMVVFINEDGKEVKIPYEEVVETYFKGYLTQSTRTRIQDAINDTDDEIVVSEMGMNGQTFKDYEKSVVFFKGLNPIRFE